MNIQHTDIVKYFIFCVQLVNSKDITVKNFHWLNSIALINKAKARVKKEYIWQTTEALEDFHIVFSLNLVCQEIKHD